MIKNIFYFLIVGIAISCTSTEKYNQIVTYQKHSASDLKIDLALTYKILKEGHPGLYWYISKKELDKKYDSVNNSITEPLTTNQFYIKIAPFVAAINCGHTSIKLPTVMLTKKETEKAKENIAPLSQFSYTISNDKRLYILANKNKNSLLKTGSEILSINANRSTNIIRTLEESISSDGYNIGNRDRSLERTFALKYKIYYGNVDSVLITYKSKNDSVGQILVKDYHKDKDTVVKTLRKSGQTAKSTPTKQLKYRGKMDNGKYLLDFKLLENNPEYAYLKIQSFSVPLADYQRFYKQCFDSIKRVGSENLILDLRDNGGGSLNASRDLFAYLTDKDFTYLDKSLTTGFFDANKYGTPLQKVIYFLNGHKDRTDIDIDEDGNFYSFMKGSKPLKPNKDNFKGKVYVLINGFTFSASSLLSANLKGINRATFVGVETGGGANQCTAGKLPVVVLPKSKLSLRFGLYKMAPVYKTDTYGRGIFPDIELSSSIADKVKGIDRELDWIKNDIKTRR